MFVGGERNATVVAVLVALLGILVALSFTRLAPRNEKFYVSALLLAFVAASRASGLPVEQVLLLSGMVGVLISVGVAIVGRSEEGRGMAQATYDAVLSASKTSVSVMLAAASAGLIQAVLTMTGLITSIGYDLVSITGGHLFLLLPLAMLFSLILGMGVPTTANYIITSLVVSPAIFLVVKGAELYGVAVPGFSTSVALLAAHFFVFYFGILADVTPPVALASYAGCAIARGDFWKTSLNAVKYASAGYVGPYVYFLHPQLFLVTVGDWSVTAVLYVLFCVVGALVAMFLLATAITGWCDGKLRREIRLLLLVWSLAVVVTMHPAVVVAGMGVTVALRWFPRRLIGVLY
jgi:TRAP-type uncharacterized transport system fused permease subunit